MRVVKINDKSNASYTKKYQDHIPYSFVYRVVCIDNRFSELVVLYIGQHAVNKFIEAILIEYDYCKKIVLTKIASWLQKWKKISIK